MSDYEKELAIHDWLVHWGNYDAAARSNARSGTPDPDNANPYAMLFNKKGICLGFSTTFQLFMDMLDVESILVNGKTSRGGAHAWNVVRIDGQWYCVDTTWNAPSDKKRTDTVTHKYFNVTSDYMWDTGHRWDRDAIPEATSEKLYYKP
jgi:transglutaminase/protease-like cytokinesis protein 3